MRRRAAPRVRQVDDDAFRGEAGGGPGPGPVDDQCPAARVPHPQQGDQQPGGPAHQHTDPAALGDALFPQSCGEVPRLPEQLPVRQRVVARPDGDRAGRGRGGPADEFEGVARSGPGDIDGRLVPRRGARQCSGQTVQLRAGIGGGVLRGGGQRIIGD